MTRDVDARRVHQKFGEEIRTRSQERWQPRSADALETPDERGGWCAAPLATVIFCANQARAKGEQRIVAARAAATDRATWTLVDAGSPILR